MSIVVILILLALAWSLLSFRQVANPFRHRVSQGRLWRRAFPWATKKQIREFLAVFADALAFRDTDLLKFRPDDQLLGIYKTLPPSKWLSDAAGLQKLAGQLRARYGVILEDVWDEHMTLGALFAHVQHKRQGNA